MIKSLNNKKINNCSIYGFFLFVKFFFYFFSRALFFNSNAFVKHKFFFCAVFNKIKIFSDLVLDKPHLLEYDKVTFKHVSLKDVSFKNFYNKSSSKKKNFNTETVLKNKENFTFIKTILHTYSEKSFFKAHHHYNLFFMKDLKKKITVVDLNRFKKRWLESESLILNIYFYDLSPLFFGAIEFKNELLALNWNKLNCGIEVWRYTHPFFISKSPKFSPLAQHFYKKLKMLQISFLFLTDAVYHYKNIHFFKKNFFTIAPINHNLSPWIVDYPIPVFSTSHHAQFFFIKVLSFLEKNSLFIKYNFSKSSFIGYCYNNI